MVTLMTFALCEKERSVRVAGLETEDASTDGITGLDTGREVLNNSTISDVFLDLMFDEQDDELVLLLDP